MAELSLKGARERLAGAILDLGRRYGKRTSKGILLDLPISRGELADLVGIALATASRFFHELKETRVIKARGRSILILRTEQLRKENGQFLNSDED